MPKLNAADEDWDLLLSFLPPNWRELAQSTSALKGLRQDKSEENYLRVLLMHLGCGLSMRETVVRAEKARLAELSDVALLKRLRKSCQWLYQLCRALFEERGVQPKVRTPQNLRLIDATDVKEPGKTGSLWRIHYSLRCPLGNVIFLRSPPPRAKERVKTYSNFPCRLGTMLWPTGVIVMPAEFIQPSAKERL